MKLQDLLTELQRRSGEKGCRRQVDYEVCRTMEPNKPWHWCDLCLTTMIVTMSPPDMIQDVRDFHRAIAYPIGEHGPRVPDDPSRGLLRYLLIKEESRELLDAIEDGNMPGVAKEACDVLYVVIGAALSYGIDLAPAWREVHRANMAKAGGPVRHDGKQLPPEGWQAADVEKVLREQGWQGESHE